ncbi:unnamed protein product [Caenorhabditis angaria]|uniref:Metalloendopeptidase n=1 Tax=Caenorhabditis angaria TaxID=860376 RepID=A0A9P1I3E8_9PELO|nr:unnamed protein product [Caenorhabditis angaria]
MMRYSIFLTLFFVNFVDSRGTLIDIFSGGNCSSDRVSHKRLLQSYKDRQVYRNAVYPDSKLRWSEMKDNDGNYQIPYIITGIFIDEELEMINKVIETIQSNTCIRFIPRINQRDYLEIRNVKGDGCYGTIGRYPGRNLMNLESNGLQSCFSFPTVIHEFLHIIGIYHEHMRYDRDDYIKVQYENIASAEYPQFEKLGPEYVSTYNIPYDFTSVMHYNKYAFALPGKISMKTIDPKYQDVIGNSPSANENDYAKVCATYNCKKCMNQDFKEIYSKKNMISSKPIQTIRTPKYEKCSDYLPVCRTLKNQNLLNCDSMSKYCCFSCSTASFYDKLNDFYM